MIRQRLGLLDLDKEVVLAYVLSLADADGHYLAFRSRRERVLHLHGFEDEKSIARINFLPNLDVDSINLAWHRGPQLLVLIDGLLSSKNLTAFEREWGLDRVTVADAINHDLISILLDRNDLDRITDTLAREEVDAIGLLNHLDLELTAFGTKLVLVLYLELIVLFTILANGDKGAVLNVFAIIVHDGLRGLEMAYTFLENPRVDISLWLLGGIAREVAVMVVVGNSEESCDEFLMFLTPNETIHASLDEGSIEIALPVYLIVKYGFVEGDSSLYACYDEVAEGMERSLDSLVARLTMDDEFGDHGVEKWGDLGTDAYARIDAYIVVGREAEILDHTDAGGEAGLHVLGIDSALDCPTIELNVFLRDMKLLARGDEQLQLDKIETCDHLGHRMLDLNTSIHLHEEEVVILVEKELNSSKALVLSLLSETYGSSCDLLTESLVESW